MAANASAPSRASIDLRDLRADDLRYVLAVSRSGTLVAAADALGVNHTTVARRVHAVEQVIGQRLLERGVEGWVLTDAGRTVASGAQAIERALERLAHAVAGDSEPSLRGTVRISAPDGFGAVFVTSALTSVREHHPHLQTELVTATRDLTGHTSGFDLALVVGNASGSHLVTEHLTDYALGLYASSDYLKRRGTPGALSELRRHEMIFYIDSMLQSTSLDIRRLLPDLSPSFRSTNVFAQVEATRLGAGIGVLPAFLAHRAGLVRVLPHEADMRLPIMLATRKDSTSHRAMLAVRSAIRDQVALHREELLPPLDAQ